MGSVKIERNKKVLLQYYVIIIIVSTRSVRKVSGLVSQKKYKTSNFVPFWFPSSSKEPPWSLNNFPILFCFLAWISGRILLGSYIRTFKILLVFKISSIDHSLEFGQEEKIIRSRIVWIGDRATRVWGWFHALNEANRIASRISLNGKVLVWNLSLNKLFLIPVLELFWHMYIVN